jgi:hypothetical protein
MAKCVHRVCGREFGGVTAFDRHLSWSKSVPFVTCLEPEGVGLVARDGVWGMPTPQMGGAR